MGRTHQMSIFTDLARLLFPARANGEEDHVYRWRLATALLIWSTSLSLWGFVALAFGICELFRENQLIVIEPNPTTPDPSYPRVEGSNAGEFHGRGGRRRSARRSPSR